MNKIVQLKNRIWNLCTLGILLLALSFGAYQVRRHAKPLNHDVKIAKYKEIINTVSAEYTRITKTPTQTSICFDLELYKHQYPDASRILEQRTQSGYWTKQATIVTFVLLQKDQSVVISGFEGSPAKENTIAVAKCLNEPGSPYHDQFTIMKRNGYAIENVPHKVHMVFAKVISLKPFIGPTNEAEYAKGFLMQVPMLHGINSDSSPEIVAGGLNMKAAWEGDILGPVFMKTSYTNFNIPKEIVLLLGLAGVIVLLAANWYMFTLPRVYRRAEQLQPAAAPVHQELADLWGPSFFTLLFRSPVEVLETRLATARWDRKQRFLQEGTVDRGNSGDLQQIKRVDVELERLLARFEAGDPIHAMIQSALQDDLPLEAKKLALWQTIPRAIQERANIQFRERELQRNINRLRMEFLEVPATKRSEAAVKLFATIKDDMPLKQQYDKLCEVKRLQPKVTVTV